MDESEQTLMGIFFCQDPLWNHYLARLPHKMQDLYHTSEYHRAHEINGDGTPLLFVYESQGELGLYPFIKNQVPDCGLNGKYYDIQSIYGYSGPLTSTDDNRFCREFENAFLDYANSACIVAEFVRFHPLLNNYGIFTNNIDVIFDRQTVVLELHNDLEYIQNHQLSSNGRRDIRVAQRKGVTTEISNNSSAFTEIYKDTMIRLNAEKYYHFNNHYFSDIADMSSTVFVDAYIEKKIVASAIFFVFGSYCSYHLSGSVKDFSSYCPMNLLLWDAINYAKEKKCKTFHLGGGRTPKSDDSLLHFKSNFSKDRAMYHIGKRILNTSVYDELIGQWEEKNNKRATILLEYRN